MIIVILNGVIKNSMTEKKVQSCLSTSTFLLGRHDQLPQELICHKAQIDELQDYLKKNEIIIMSRYQENQKERRLRGDEPPQDNQDLKIVTIAEILELER